MIQRKQPRGLQEVQSEKRSRTSSCTLPSAMIQCHSLYNILFLVSSAQNVNVCSKHSLCHLVEALHLAALNYQQSQMWVILILNCRGKNVRVHYWLKTLYLLFIFSNCCLSPRLSSVFVSDLNFTANESRVSDFSWIQISTLRTCGLRLSHIPCSAYGAAQTDSLEFFRKFACALKTHEIRANTRASGV